MCCCSRCGDSLTSRGSILDVEGPLRTRIPRPLALCHDCGLSLLAWLHGGKSGALARLPRPRPASPAAVRRSAPRAAVGANICGP